ncbi:MAG: extracellular solute-binding protein [Clostridia bacterium]|nr:extracellular solute-binding protein [Clostridia bacterium]
MKKSFTRILALLLVCFVFSACSDDQTDDTTQVTAVADSEFQLPTYDFDNHAFYILSVGRNENSNDFLYKEENPSVLDAATERRNKSVEALYNIKIVSEQQNTTANYQSPEAFSALVREATAGDTNYDLCVIPGYDVCRLACQGYLTDLHTLPYFDGEQEWYDQKANEAFTFANKLYFTTGDSGVSMMNQTFCIAFNKKLAEEYQLEDMYELVNSNQWTLEKMYDISKKVASDTNGDGETDVYGTMYWVDAAYGIVNGAGQRSVVLNPDTLNMELALNSETTHNVLEDFAEMVLNPEVSIKYQHNSKAKEYIEVFSGNHALFFMTTIGKLSEFRDMETDYGILPYVMYKSEQQEYCNTVSPFNAVYTCVPLVMENRERTSAVMEAIGYYSKEYIIPAYYDKTLNGQYVRDSESAKMLDIIFDTRAYDLGYMFQPAQLPENMLFMIRDGVFDWSSRYSALEIPAQNFLNFYSESYRKTVNITE